MSPETIPPPIPEVARQPAIDRVWRPGPLLGWICGIAGGYLVVQTIVVAIFMIPVVMRHENVDPSQLNSSGSLLAVSGCATAVVTVLMCFLAVRSHKVSVTEHLALHLPRALSLFKWLAYLVIYIVASDGLTWWLGRPLVTDFMIRAYESAGAALPLLWLCLLVGAPLAEEFFFRGLMFSALVETRLRFIGTILLTSALWAFIHRQYGLYGIAQVFGIGVVLGFARWRTGSLWTTVFLHGVVNLVSTFELLAKLRG
jgi:membrane protease YdiL (CAAX protease family)